LDKHRLRRWKAFPARSIIMRRSITLAAVALFASSVFAMPAIAQNGNGNGNGGGNGNGNGGGQAEAPGASGFAPGHLKSDDTGARSFAPGRQTDTSAREAAPGQKMRAAGTDTDDDDDDDVDDDTTASVRSNYGTVISLIRSGKADLSDLPSDIDVTFVEVDDLKPTGNRTALDNALEARAEAIEDLRDEIDEIEALADVDLETVVAAQVAADGTLIVYVDEDEENEDDED
jgi:hypothetical protein